MAESLIIIPGLTGDDKVPGEYGYTVFNAGRVATGLAPMKCLVVGNKLTAGSRTVETGPWPVVTEADADAQFGAGSELARMCYAALKIDGVELWAYPVTEAAGATPAYWIVLHSGSISGSGQVSLRIGKTTYVYTTVTSIAVTAANCAAAINADWRAPWSAAVDGSNRVIITTRQAGIRANQYWAKIDTSLQATGLTTTLYGVLEAGTITRGGGAGILTLSGAPATTSEWGCSYYVSWESGTTTGDGYFRWSYNTGAGWAATGVSCNGATGAALGSSGLTAIFPATGNTLGHYWTWSAQASSHNGLRQATAGSGTDSVATCLSALAGAEWPRQAWAHNDAVNLALIEAHVDQEAATTIDHLEHAVAGVNGTSAAATSLANTTMNAYRMELLWCGYQAVSPVEWVAEFVANRAVTEQSNPNPNYDGYKFKTMVPLENADIPVHATLKSLLNNGVSPCTMNGSDPVMVRAIVSHCLNGVNPDYGTLDTGDATTPDRVRRDLCTIAKARRAAMHYAGPDPAAEVGNPPDFTETPKLWKAAIVGYEKEKERLNWLQSVDSYPPRVDWDSQTKRIMSSVPVLVKAHNHQYGISVNQLATE